MSGAISSITDTFSSAVKSAAGILGSTAEAVSDVIGDIDVKDAAATFIQTGNPYLAAIAATDLDEDLSLIDGMSLGTTPNEDGGYSPQTSYEFDETGNEDTFSVSFMPGEQGGVPDDVTIGGVPKGIYDAFGNIATNIVNELSTKAENDNAQAQIYGDSSRQLVNSFSGILADVASGKYSKSPASEYNTRSVLDAYSNQNMGSSLSAGLLADYNAAKQKVATMVETPSSQFGQLAMQDNPFYNFMQQRNIGKAPEAANVIFQNYVSNMPQNEVPQQNIFEPYLQEKGIV